jgi:hypothetical protein
VGILLLARALPAWADIQIVTNTNDSGPGSLRDAIASASPGDAIQFSVTGTIALTSGELLLAKDLTIKGPGASQLVISGNHNDRVFEISPGATVILSRLTVENGTAATGISNGGGILNGGTLTLRKCTITGNSVGNGPRIGGGLYNFGTATVTDSTIAGNSAYAGGGLANDANSTLTLTNSTVVGNSAPYGGGLLNDGTTTVTNSTVTGNTTGSSPYSYYTGGILNAVGMLTIKSTLLANNTGGNCILPAELTASQGYNLSDDSSCVSAFTAAGDQNNVVAGAGLDPKGLQNNGGPTPTIALLPTSPAVDHIPVANCTDPQDHRIRTDQRGIARPQGASCDVGAFELVQTVPFSSFNADLALFTRFPSGFVLISWFTLGTDSPGLQPLSEALTLQIASYTVTLPAGSLHRLWDAPDAPYGYEGTINGTHLALGLFPLGDNRYEFDAAGFPVAWINVQNPVKVSLTIGQDAGSTTVNAFIRPY